MKIIGTSFFVVEIFFCSDGWLVLGFVLVFRIEVLEKRFLGLAIKAENKALKALNFCRWRNKRLEKFYPASL